MIEDEPVAIFLPDILAAEAVRNDTEHMLSATSEPDNTFMEGVTFGIPYAEHLMRTSGDSYSEHTIRLYADKLADAMEKNLCWYHTTHYNIWRTILDAPFSGELRFEQILNGRTLAALASLYNEWERRVIRAYKHSYDSLLICAKTARENSR